MKEQVAEWLMDSRLDDLVNFFKENTPENISKHSIEEQRTIKGALQEELERRVKKIKRIKQGYLSMSENLIKVNNDIKLLLELQSSGYDVSKALEQANNSKRGMESELEEQRKLIYEENQIVDLISSNLKANKYSEHKKRFNDFKLKMRSAPQKICTLSISMLEKMKDRAENKYNESYGKLYIKFKNSEMTMKLLEKEKDKILEENSELSSIEKYAKGLETEKKQRRELKKAKRYARKSNILAKLNGNFVRSINISIDMYEKLEGKYEEKAKVA